MLLTFLSAALLTFVGNDPLWENASVSAYAMNTVTGEVILDEQGEKSLMTASCVKVIIAGAALSLLGKETHFHTDLEYTGTIDPQGVLLGNIYIKGGGDPCLGSGRNGLSLSFEKQLEVWVQEIQKAGIKEILGEVIPDSSLWKDDSVVWSWAAEDLGNYYGAGPSALSFHENYYDLVLKPGPTVGSGVDILRIEPKVDGLLMKNNLATGPDGSGDRAWIYGTELSPICRVQGTVPMGSSEFTIRGSIQDPPHFCAQSLVKALSASGIAVRHQETKAETERVFLHRTKSPTIEEIVSMMNQKSINLYAEHLLKKLGESVYGEGSTESGLRVIRSFLESQKIDTKGLNLVDGSGLSRKDLMTAKQFVVFLSKVKELPIFSTFLHSLPEISPGIRAKSGCMSLARGAVGYAGDVAFAILINYAVGLDPEKKILTFLPKLVTNESL